MLRILSLAILAQLAAASAVAQPFIYDARWFAGVRDTVLTIQERQRARLEALEKRRRAAAAPKPVLPANALAIPTAGATGR